MAIVLMMTIPGLAVFYGGMVRKKNIGDTVMTSFAITCLVSILWLLFTYSCPSGTPNIGGAGLAFCKLARQQYVRADGVGLNIGTPNPLKRHSNPWTVYSMFQLTFAIITAALIAGLVCGRMKFSAMLWFIGGGPDFRLFAGRGAHWVWGPDGIFNSANPDAIPRPRLRRFGTVVHVEFGHRRRWWAALMLRQAQEGGT